MPITRNTLKHPVTPTEIADSLDEWYENGRKGLETFCARVKNDAAEEMAWHWFEKGRARFNPLIDALRSLEDDR